MAGPILATVSMARPRTGSDWPSGDALTLWGGWVSSRAALTHPPPQPQHWNPDRLGGRCLPLQRAATWFRSGFPGGPWPRTDVSAVLFEAAAVIISLTRWQTALEL